MATASANKDCVIYTEFVWRKEGEERCDWTPIQRPTEKKALREDKEPSTIFNQGSDGLGEHSPNKREAACAKINERYLVGQAIQNPFMPNSNYANDLEVQMNFLTPTKG